MTKPILIDTSCPTCKKDHVVTVNPDDIALAVGKIHDTPSHELPSLDLETKIEEVLAKKMPKKEEKPPEVQKEVEYPSFMPGEYCASGNCELGGVHPNKNYKIKPSKRCKNCMNMAPSKAPKCAWCGEKEFEDMDDEDLETFGISLPNLEVHEHVH